MLQIAQKLYSSTIWSWHGLKYAYTAELAFRLEVWVALSCVPIAIKLAEDFNQMFWLIFSVFLVLIVELINTAIEATVDRIGAEQHVLAKHAKDTASAAVFISVIFAAIVWGSICYAKF